MKKVLVILILFLCSHVSAQEWRDSLNVARSAYKKQEYAKALKYYQSAQKKAPDNVDLSDEMGQSAYKAREFERAEKIYQQSAAAKKNTTDKAKTYHNMGNSRMQKKDYLGAVESYKDALRNNPNDEETRYNLSEAIRRLKDDQKKQQQDQNDHNKQDQNKQDQKDQQKNQSKQNSGDDQKNKQNNPQNNSKRNKQENGDGQNNPSRLPNKSVERMLDQLTKAEAETKRKMGGSRDQGSTNKSGKDW